MDDNVIQFPVERTRPKTDETEWDLASLADMIPFPKKEPVKPAKKKKRTRPSQFEGMDISSIGCSVVASMFPGDLNPFEDIILTDFHFAAFTAVCCGLIGVDEGTLNTTPLTGSRIENIIKSLTSKEKSDIVTNVIKQYQRIWS